MAKVTLQPPFISFRGRVGDLVFRTYPNGQVIVSAYPDMSNVVWSPAQVAHRRRMKRAVAYAKAAMADPEVAAIYRKRAAEQDGRPFQLAVSDYFKGKDLLAEKKRAGQAAALSADLPRPVPAGTAFPRSKPGNRGNAAQVGGRRPFFLIRKRDFRTPRAPLAHSGPPRASPDRRTVPFKRRLLRPFPGYVPLPLAGGLA